MKKVLTILVIIGLVFSMSEAFGQLTFGEKPDQTIKIRIDENGLAHVTHEVKGNPETRQQIETIPGTMSNLLVTDKDGNEIQYLTLEKYPLAVVLTPSKKDLIFIKYDLGDLLVLKDNIWTLEWTGNDVTNFYFPKDVDIIWINDRPVYLGESGIRHHGGTMKVEYVLKEPVILKGAVWEGKKLDVTIRTLTNVSDFVFDQPSKRITFDTQESNSSFTVIIPLELLWEPYEVYVNNNKTLNSEFHNNGTHVWLGFKPKTSGSINIIGTTVIPEFPLFVPLVIGMTLILLLNFRKKFYFR